MDHFDVVVIGAGVAGLAAGRRLRDAGRSVLILEARKRIGGRIHTIHDPASAEPAELGAEFVHGSPPELMRILRQANVAVTPVTGDRYCVEGGAIELCGECEDRLGELLRGHQGEDTSIEELLNAAGLQACERRRIRTFVEGYNAADARRASVYALARQAAAEQALDGDRICRVQGGYDAVVGLLNTGLNVRTNTPVEQIRWRPGLAEVRGRRQAYKGDRVVITVPLGVLQSGSIRFEPPPSGSLQAAARLAMGTAIRITMRFDERPWMRHDKLATAGFVHAPGMPFPAWWTRGQMLTAWAGGCQTEALRKMSREELIQAAAESLASICGGGDLSKLKAEIGAVHYHDWAADPYSLGAYSYVPAGALDAVEQLAKPVEGTLFFAGEATEFEGNWGTVHGAIRSGERAADTILEQSG